MGSTRESVAAWRERDPEASAAEMARELGVSRTRIGQLLESLGLPTRTNRSGSHGLARKPPAIESRIRTGGGPVKINSRVAGNIAELLVAADLLARGYRVFGPISKCSSGADLIAVGNRGYARPRMIEVRSGKRGASGALHFRKQVYGKHPSWKPHYAVVVIGEPITYVPDLPVEESEGNRGGR